MANVILVLAGLVCAGLFLVAQLRGLVGFIAILGALYCFSLAGVRYSRARQARRQRPAGSRPPVFVPEQQAKEYGRFRWIGALAGAALTGHSGYALFMLETGRAESAMFWGPVGVIYEFFGPWAAFLTPLGLTVFLLYALGAMARDMERKAKERESA